MKKDIIVAVMRFKGKEYANGDTSDALSYHCPGPGCVKPIIRFQEDSGFSNLYKHLRSCYVRGRAETPQDEIIFSLYHEDRTTTFKCGGTIDSQFAIRALIDFDKTVYSCIRIIIKRCLPVAVVEHDEFRLFSKFDVQVG